MIKDVTLSSLLSDWWKATLRDRPNDDLRSLAPRIILPYWPSSQRCIIDVRQAVGQKDVRRSLSIIWRYSCLHVGRIAQWLAVNRQAIVVFFTLLFNTNTSECCTLTVVINPQTAHARYVWCFVAYFIPHKLYLIFSSVFQKVRSSHISWVSWRRTSKNVYSKYAYLVHCDIVQKEMSKHTMAV